VIFTNDYLDFVIGKDQTDTMRVSFTDFNLVAGAPSASEAKATANTASSTDAAKIVADAGGTTFLSDGVTTISVDLTDIRIANNDASLAASGVTAEKMAIALQAKADENTAFKLDITHNSTTGFTYTEKTGKGGDDGSWHGRDDRYLHRGRYWFEWNWRNHYYCFRRNNRHYWWCYGR
jgi:hypothetical protein